MYYPILEWSMKALQCGMMKKNLLSYKGWNKVHCTAETVPFISKVCQLYPIYVGLSHYWEVFTTHFCGHFAISRYLLADNLKQIEGVFLHRGSGHTHIKFTYFFVYLETRCAYYPWQLFFTSTMISTDLFCQTNDTLISH